MIHRGYPGYLDASETDTSVVSFTNLKAIPEGSLSKTHLYLSKSGRISRTDVRCSMERDPIPLMRFLFLHRFEIGWLP